MRFEAEERVDAPAEWAFARLSDTAAIEAAARRRGLEVVREGPPAAAAGAAWRVGFPLGGARREARVTVAEHEPPRRMRLSADAGGVAGDLVVEVVPEGPDACRLAVSADLAGSGLRGRAMMQPLRLARGRIGERFARAVEDAAAALSRRRAAGGGGGRRPQAAARRGSAG